MSTSPTSRPSILQALRPLVRRYPWLMLAVIATGVLSALAEGIGLGLFIPLLESLGNGSVGAATGPWFVDAIGQLFQDLPPGRRLMVLGGCIAGAVVVKALLAYGRNVLYSLLDARVGHALRSSLFAQYLSVNYRFWEQNDSDRLYNALSGETWRTTRAMCALAHLVVTVFTLLIYGGLLLLISWPLTLFVFGVMGIMALPMQRLRRRVEQLGRMATRVNVSLTNRMLEGFSGMQVIRAFGRTDYEGERFDRASRRVSSVFLRLGIVSGLVHPIYELLAVGLVIGVLVVMGQGGMSLPAMLVFLFVLYRLYPQVRDLDGARVALATQAGPVDEVMTLLDDTNTPRTASGNGTIDRLDDPIRYDRVTFEYATGDPPALNKVSAEIRPGQTTALVGPSGAGKSTFIKLLLRLYDPTDGTISVDGRPLPTLDLKAWRRRLAVVGQEGEVFNTSVRANIAYGRLDATDADIEAAARLADAHGFIQCLSRGYDTRVGDQGVRLSGGQKQRLTLARALVRRADLVILDEATNSLDSLSEDLIQEALETLRGTCTFVVIAHRFSTILQADHVIVLDEGRVCQQGSPADLLAQEGLFADLYARQAAPPVPG